MLILTTIYFVDLKDMGTDGVPENMFDLEQGTDKSNEPLRELLGLYEGRNRVIPIDRNS